MYISDFLILEISSHRFVQNILRDFQISWNYETYENCPFSRSIFHQKRKDIANQKYVMTISMGKRRKCTSQIFYFRNFITQICGKNMKIAHFLGQFSTRNGWKCHIKNISWGSAWKIEENVHLGFFYFGNFITEIFWKHSPKVIKCQNYENWAFWEPFPPQKC